MLAPSLPILVTRWGRWSMLRSARWNAGYSQAELAAAVHASRSTISRLERGVAIPSLSLALALARELDISVEDLFPDDERR